MEESRVARVSSPLLTQLTLSATEHGAFASCGVDWNHPQTREHYALHVDRYRAWIAAGHAGPMQYLVRGTDRRANPELVFPGLKSAFVALFAYPGGTRQPGAWTRGPEYARYMSGIAGDEGLDYHTVIQSRLATVFEHARENHPELEYKVCVDTSAVLERAWGEMAGLGWIGKNTLLIHPTQGSFFFIGVVFTNQAFGLGPALLPNYCGHCTRCLSACPTQALDSAGELSPSRCISALTLETRGPRTDTLGVDAVERRSWVAGCDRCQEVCPFNRKRAVQEGPSPALSLTVQSWEEHFAETEVQYRARVQGTALSRVKFADARRNLQIAFDQLPPEIREPILARLQSP